MPRPFQETLHNINNGTLLHDAAEAMAELVLAVDSTGKAGKIIIEINVRKATARTMAVVGKVTVKKPQEPLLESLLFPTADGNLLTEDPAQMKLPLKAINTPSAADLTLAAS